MTGLLDVNVLVALAWPNHVHHAAARTWFASFHRDGWATCPLTESGFIRVASNRRVNPEARTPAAAALLLSQMCGLPGHSWVTDDIRLSMCTEQEVGLAHASPHVTDLHLSLLARRAGASLVTFDRGAAQLAAALGATSILLSL